MAYTRIWTNAQPIPSNPANQLATYIQNVRGDIEERMATLVTGWNTGAPTDPIVALPAISGKITSKTLYLSANDFIIDTAIGGVGFNTSAITSEAVWLSSSASTARLRATFNLGIGSILQNVKILGYLGVGNTMSFQVYRTAFTTSPSVTNIGTAGNFVANGTTQIINAGGNPFGHTVATLNMYKILVTMVGSGTFAELMGAEITYDVADSTQLI